MRNINDTTGKTLDTAVAEFKEKRNRQIGNRNVLKENEICFSLEEFTKVLEELKKEFPGLYTRNEGGSKVLCNFGEDYSSKKEWASYTKEFSEIKDENPKIKVSCNYEKIYEFLKKYNADLSKTNAAVKSPTSLYDRLN